MVLNRTVARNSSTGPFRL